MASALGGIILGVLGFGALNAMGATVSLGILAAARLQRGQAVSGAPRAKPRQRPA